MGHCIQWIKLRVNHAEVKTTLPDLEQDPTVGFGYI